MSGNEGRPKDVCARILVAEFGFRSASGTVVTLARAGIVMRPVLNRRHSILMSQPVHPAQGAATVSVSSPAERVTHSVGLQRFPWLTAVVFAVTAVTGLTQFLVPELLSVLERTPAGLHGEWWRSATSLFVQDGGLLGGASNLIVLALIGTLAEQVLSRPRWLAHYFGVGLITELLAYAWQPVGGGNSIAVCGLTGAVAVASWRADSRLPTRVAQISLLVWCGALLSTLSSALSISVIALTAGLTWFAVASTQRVRPVRRLTVAVVALTGVILSAATNIHGGALLIGLLLGFLAVGIRLRAR
jgi:membrane associated rhomboid family serine protease